MVRRLEEFGKYIAILGVDNVKIQDVDDFLRRIRKINANIQVFNAASIAGYDHLLFASINALKAFRDGYNISKSLPIEILLYASGQRQIDKAIDMLGITTNITSIAAVAIANSEEKLKRAMESLIRVTNGRRNDQVLAMTNEKATHLRKLFDISNGEIKSGKSITELIVERVALLTIRSKD